MHNKIVPLLLALLCEVACARRILSKSIRPSRENDEYIRSEYIVSEGDERIEKQPSLASEAGEYSLVHNKRPKRLLKPSLLCMCLVLAMKKAGQTFNCVGPGLAGRVGVTGPPPALRRNGFEHRGIPSSRAEIVLSDEEPGSRLGKSYVVQKRFVESAPGMIDRARIGTLDVPMLGVGTIAWGLRGIGGLLQGVERAFTSSSGAATGAETVVLASKLKGVDFFDTAERYGNSISTAVGLGYGETEELIAKTLKELDMDAVVATKFTPSPFRTTPESVLKACKASRDRLGVEKIDLYQIQIPDIVQPWARIPGAPNEWSKSKDEIYWEGMVMCYNEGIISNVGVSNYGPTLLKRANEYFKARGVPLVSNQINYSLLYRKRGAQATVDACRELGIKVLAYFPLGMGVLTGKWETRDYKTEVGIGPVGEPTKPDFTGKSSLEQLDIEQTARGAAPLLETLSSIAKRRNKTVPQIALNWVMCKGAIPIPGARTYKQIIDNAGALGWRLSDEEVSTLEEAADKSDTEFSGAGFKRSNSKFVGYGYEDWELD